jgi:cytochrome b561
VTSRIARASLGSNRKAHGMPEVRWSLGAAAVAAGWTDIHAVFGTLLCALVAWQFLQHARDPAQWRHAEVREFARRVSRMVYLMLYLVLSLKLLTGVTSLSWHDGGVVLGWSPRFKAAPELTFIECGEGFRGDLLCGVIVLCLIRALSVYQHRHAVTQVTAQPAPITAQPAPMLLEK